MRRVVDPLRVMGAALDGRADGGFAPLVVRGGNLVGAAHRLAVASAQVKTALVLAGLQADGATEIVEPAPSRDHTERMLGALGAPLDRLDATTVGVAPGAPSAFDMVVPGDSSSAAFWAVGAAIVPGSDVVIEGVCANPTRIAFVDVLRRMGANVEVELTGEEVGEPVGNLHVTAAPLRATTIEGAEMALVADEIPVLALAAAAAEGVTEIRDAAELRVKESDRIATVGDLLTRAGIRVELGAAGLAVHGGRLQPGAFTSHGDHRVAMAGAIAALAAAGESTIDGWSAAAVSYPEFTDDLATLTGAPGRHP
jgi:3-phosphoshikimate 1-carboxyvinyltransferase